MEVSIGQSPNSMAHFCHVWWLRRVKSPFQNPIQKTTILSYFTMFPCFSHGFPMVFLQFLIPNFSPHRWPKRSDPQISAPWVSYHTGPGVVFHRVPRGGPHQDRHGAVHHVRIGHHPPIWRRKQMPWRSSYTELSPGYLNNLLNRSQKISMYIHV